MRKLVKIGLIGIVLLFMTNNLYAGDVLDNNTGESGDILVNSGGGGGEDVGTWTDPADVQGLEGEAGEEGEDGEDGENGEDGEDGKKGDQGVPGLQGKGLKDRYETQFEIWLNDTKNSRLSFYYIRDHNNDIDTLGMKFTYKFGESYSDKLEKRIAEIERMLKIQTQSKEETIEIVPDKDGLKVQRRF